MPSTLQVGLLRWGGAASPGSPWRKGKGRRVLAGPLEQPSFAIYTHTLIDASLSNDPYLLA